MERQPTPSERVASRYADLFVDLFSRVAADPRVPFVAASPSPQQGMDGVPFRGANALVTSVAAAREGYHIPVWLTMARKDSLGLMVRKGERGVPITHYDFYYEDVGTGRRDPAMTDALYSSLTDEERRGWVRRCHMRCWMEFNIAQTDFPDVYPEQWAGLEALFGSRKAPASCGILDRMVDEGTWMCPVVPSVAASTPLYVEDRDVIEVPPKGSYADESRWYSDLLREMAHSTGSEGRMDRGLGSSSLTEVAAEELVAELAGAVMGTFFGLQSTLGDHNVRFLKSWVTAIGETPEVIYRAVTMAARVSDAAAGRLGVSLGTGVDVQAVMDGIEAAREAGMKAMERRAERAGRIPAARRGGRLPLPSAGRKGMRG